MENASNRTFTALGLATVSNINLQMYRINYGRIISLIIPTLVPPIKDSMSLVSGFNTVLAQLETKSNVGHNAEFWSKLMQTRNVSLSGRHCWLWGSWKPLHFKLPLQKYHKTQYMLCDSWVKSWAFERVQVHVMVAISFPITISPYTCMHLYI